MKGHKWFAAIYDRMLALEERRFLGAVREEMLADLSGEVLEIGAGTGFNFPHYTSGAHVIAIEPDPFMLKRAQERAAGAAAHIELREAAAEDLPFPDASFDFVIDTLVMCTVHDPKKALSEIRRVLKPGGEYRFYEHVRYQNPVAGFTQDVVTPAWRWLGAGCHPNRDTATSISDAGFEIVQLERTKPFPPIPPMVWSRPRIRGVARHSTEESRPS